MEIFLTSISGILVILGMILVGFVMGEKGWFDDESRGLIAKLVTQIALPCYMLYTITQRFTATDLLKMLPELRFPALSMAILLGIATAVAGIFAVKKERRGLFISMFFNSNTIFVGLPIFVFHILKTCVQFSNFTTHSYARTGFRGTLPRRIDTPAFN